MSDPIDYSTLSNAELFRLSSTDLTSIDQEITSTLNAVRDAFSKVQDGEAYLPILSLVVIKGIKTMLKLDAEGNQEAALQLALVERFLVDQNFRRLVGIKF